MEEVKRLFEVTTAFSTGPEEAKVNYEVGAIVEFRDDEEFAAKIADGSLVEVTAHVVTDEDIKNNPDAGLTVGDVVHFPLVSAGEMTEEDKAAVVAAEAKLKSDEAVVEAVSEEAADPAPTPKYTHAGKPVLRSYVRSVNGRDYNHIQLESGEEFDLTDAEYEEMLKTA